MIWPFATLTFAGLCLLLFAIMVGGALVVIGIHGLRRHRSRQEETPPRPRPAKSLNPQNPAEAHDIKIDLLKIEEARALLGPLDVLLPDHAVMYDPDTNTLRYSNVKGAPDENSIDVRMVQGNDPGIRGFYYAGKKIEFWWDGFNEDLRRNFAKCDDPIFRRSVG